MSDQSLGNNGPSSLKIWGAIILGTVIAVLLAFIQGASGGENPASNLDEQAGLITGIGLAVGMMVWAVCYFVALKGASRALKWLSFLCLIAASVLAAFTGYGLTAA